MKMFQTHAMNMEMQQKIELLEKVIDKMFSLLPQESEENKQQWLELKEALSEAGYESGEK